MHPAKYYNVGTERQIQCQLCPHRCRLKDGQTGLCRVRRNVGGELYSTNYGACSALAVDPIEKKPLFHFYPGSEIFSVGTVGCNFACQFCQNWHIAQGEPKTYQISPAALVKQALDVGGENIGIAYTYSEPGVWFEYVLDTAALAHRYRLKNVMVTNGFINPEPLTELLPYIDALNIDVKAFTETFYHCYCRGGLAAVKQTVELAARHSHVEVTTLIIPGLNDSEDEIAELAEWLANIRPDIPLHLSRYFPNYKLDLPPTPLASLERAYQTAKRYLSYVYIGNVFDSRMNTHCPRCQTVVIDRLRGKSRLTPAKACPQCGQAISITGDVRF